jgi:hypothetical protein
MTPKEKAQELVNEFTFNCRECYNAKLSSLILVDEILKLYIELNPQTIKYYLEVKEEIQVL